MFRVMVGVTLGLGLAATVAAQDATIARGQKVYAEQKCALCHSIADQGNKKGPLDGAASRLKIEEMREWIVDAPGMTARTKAVRKPLMKSYKLPKGDEEALVSYLMTLKKK